MLTAKGRVGAAFVALLCAFFVLLQSSASAEIFHGWEYGDGTPSSSWLESYNSGLYSVKYDSEGRISEYTNTDTGVTTYIYYYGDYWEEYRDGDLIGYGTITSLLDSRPTRSAEEESTKETLKAQTRTTVRLIKSRSAALLAPKPAGAPGVKTQAKIDNVKFGGAMAMSYQLNQDDVMGGLAAGDAAESFEKLGLGVWTSGGFSLLGNSDSSTKYDGTAFVAMLGVDYMLTQRTVIGIALGIEGSYLDTNFSHVSGEMASNGYTIAPYMSIALFEELIFDIIGGVSFLSNGSTMQPYYDSVRVMISPNLTYYYILDSWLFSGTMGYTYASEDGFDYKRDSPDSLFDLPDYNGPVPNNAKPDTIETGELRFGGRAGYAFGWGMPYLDAAYIYDTTISTSDDDMDPDEMEVTLGLDLYPTDSFIVSAEVANSFFRQDTYLVRFGLNLRYEF